MPGFDGTGPLGQGPFTGGGRGFCVMPLDNNKEKSDEGEHLKNNSVNDPHPGKNDLYNTYHYSSQQKGVTNMPRGDGTGPAGMGPMTGRAAGYCTGYSAPGYANPAGGRYFGTGRGAFGGRSGRGRGYRNWYYATGLPGWQRYNMGMPAWGGVSPQTAYPYNNPYAGSSETPDQEKEMLKEEADLLKQQVADIQARLDELEKETEIK